MKRIILFVLFFLHSLFVSASLALPDAFKRLGISQNASWREVSDAYKSLAVQCHPDKNPHDVATAKENFQSLVLAYERIKVDFGCRGIARSILEEDSAINILAQGFAKAADFDCSKASATESTSSPVLSPEEQLLQKTVREQQLLLRRKKFFSREERLRNDEAYKKALGDIQQLFQREQRSSKLIWL
jgi:hypothetical protein